MKPGRVCGICASPDLSLKADSLLASGFSLVEIAAQLGVSKYTVSRHGRHSALKLTDAEAEKLPENKLDLLYDRCENLFHSLAASGDAKAAAGILTIQARLATAAVQREEVRQKEINDDKSDPVNDAGSVEFHDALLKKFEQLRVQERALGRMACPVCGSDSPNSFMHPRDIRDRMLQLLASEGFAATPTTEDQNVNSSAN
jgi:hypothetical protein